MEDNHWHSASEIGNLLSLKETRSKQLLRELVSLNRLVDNGRKNGKLYRLK